MYVKEEEVREYFQNRFSDTNFFNVKLENVQFTSLSEHDNLILVQPFAKEEIRGQYETVRTLKILINSYNYYFYYKIKNYCYYYYC